jgi:proteasome beta subunit
VSVSFPWNDPGSSFSDFLAAYRQQFPSGHGIIPLPAAQPSPLPPGTDHATWLPLPRGTTVLALCYGDGAMVAGDRMATEGYQVADRRIEKVFRADDYSAIAIAGTAGPCIELARLFQVELEHYEKLEGAQLSMEGKANKLAQMVRANLPLAMQGLIVLPLFAGFDPKVARGRIFKYDVAGGRYEEADYHATGSGGKDARTTMKKLYRPGLSKADALGVVLEALYDAAEEDVATAGPDLIRNIFPTVKVIDRTGLTDVDEGQIRPLMTRLIDHRRRG